ncbi:MAG: IS4 family transposase [Gammaproteobacteria bacterium]
MASIPFALERIKHNPLDVLDRDTVERVCREHGHAWRDRELDPATTVALFVQQVAHGNCPCTEVRHLAPGHTFTAQAYCEARHRLPRIVYQDLLSEVIEAAMPQSRRGELLWYGHRTFHVDGSTFSMPDTPELQKAFGMPSGQKEGCGFPVAHLLVLFSASTGLLVDAWASPLRTGDMAQVPEAHLHLDEGDILLGDDSFSGYVDLAMLKMQGLHGIFPAHHARIVDFKKGRPHTSEDNPEPGLPRSRWIKSLGKEDQLVEYFKPKTRPLWMSKEQWDQLPDSIEVRELRRTVCRPGLGHATLALVTTLTDPKKYPAQDLMELRLRRWDVETCIGHLKTTMGLDVLHCKSEEGVRKELAVFCLVYNLVRLVMLEASRRQEVAVSRISFADVLHWMRHARRDDVLPKFVVNPRRPDRIEPRCRKRRPKKYTLMNKPRDLLRKEIQKKHKANSAGKPRKERLS